MSYWYVENVNSFYLICKIITLLTIHNILVLLVVAKIQTFSLKVKRKCATIKLVCKEGKCFPMVCQL